MDRVSDKELDNGMVEDLDNIESDPNFITYRLENLLERRPFLLSHVVLRQNPHNVYEWMNLAKLCEVFKQFALFFSLTNFLHSEHIPKLFCRLTHKPLMGNSANSGSASLNSMKSETIWKTPIRSSTRPPRLTINRWTSSQPCGAPGRKCMSATTTTSPLGASSKKLALVVHLPTNRVTNAHYRPHFRTTFGHSMLILKPYLAASRT